MKNFPSQNDATPVKMVNEPSESFLVKTTKWIDDYDVPFFLGSGAMTIMLLWAGLYKMTVPGAEGIIPLVSNSPLTSWEFKLLGPYYGSDLIGLTEITAALCIIVGFFRPGIGMVGTFITMIMFITTSSMIITTPDAIVMVNDIGYMSFLGLFLFKDFVILGLSFFLLSSFRKRKLVTKK